MTTQAWTEATRSRPCPICGKPDWCGSTPDGAARCMRVHEGAPGWRIIIPRDINGGTTYRPADEPKTNGRLHQAPSSKPKRTYETLETAIASIARGLGGNAVGQWAYPNGAYVVRFNLPDGSKEFRPFHKPDNTGWVCGDPPGLWPLYRLDSLGDFDLWVLEGEKCADAAASLGLNATTSAHGSKAADKTDWTTIQGRNVFILPDNDQFGIDYANHVAERLTAQGCKVKVVRIPGLPPKGDLADLLGADGLWSCREPGDIIAQLDAIAEKTPQWSTKDIKPQRIQFITMSNVTAEPVEWLWTNRFPLGALSIIAGEPDGGKSTITLDIAARISRGTPFIDGAPAPPGQTIILAVEDDPGRTIRPRLDAAQADCTKVHLIQAIKDATTADGQPPSRPFDLSRDLPELERLIDHLGDVRLVIIDPLNGYLGAKVNSWRDSDVRAVLHPLVEVAQKKGVAVIGIMHEKKRQSEGPKQYAVTGSVAFVAVARAVWLVEKDPNDPLRRVMLRAKCNLASSDTTGLAYKLVPSPDGLGQAACVAWERDPVEASADQWAKTCQPQSEREEVKQWLAQTLKDRPMEAAEIEELAIRGQGFSRATLNRASRDLGVRKQKMSLSDGWMWSLTP